jgi:hypothetical protein
MADKPKPKRKVRDFSEIEENTNTKKVCEGGGSGIEGEDTASEGGAKSAEKVECANFIGKSGSEERGANLKRKKKRRGSEDGKNEIRNPMSRFSSNKRGTSMVVNTKENAPN